MIGLITGSGFYDLPGLQDREPTSVDTPYGAVTVTTGRWHGRSVAFLARHGTDHTIPPHGIDYRANIWALWSVGVTGIIATAVSGAVNPALAPGTLVLISDFVDYTSGRADTFFDGVVDPGFDPEGPPGVVHTAMTDAYHPGLRALLAGAAEEAGIAVVGHGVYCTFNGPRFESPAEITMMGRLGVDLVGMTGYPEVALAREAGIPYASIGVVSNPAAGLGDDEVAHGDIMVVVEKAGARLLDLIGRAVERSSGTDLGI
ncbi:MAG: S-methyl-5'-thioinosine phosphorylase [Acidimicrobiales bacterium]